MQRQCKKRPADNKEELSIGKLLRNKSKKINSTNSLFSKGNSNNKYLNYDLEDEESDSSSKNSNYQEEYDSENDEKNFSLKNSEVNSKKSTVGKLTTDFNKKAYIKEVNLNKSESKSFSNREERSNNRNNNLNNNNLNNNNLTNNIISTSTSNSVINLSSTNNIKKANKTNSRKSLSKKSLSKKISQENSDADIDDETSSLPCREKEQEFIYNYIKSGLNTSGAYSSLYISGMPGTGKTACVSTMLNKLRKEAKQKLIPAFNILELNGMKITTPQNVFKYIYEYIFTDGRSTNVKKCTNILDNFFKNRNEFNFKTQLRDVSNPHLVLVIDEIDCLIHKKQILLYNLFNWTTYTDSKLIIISISNTLDLPEKLQTKISSRMGNNRLSFKPYLKEELGKILSYKIENFELFSDDAIKLSSMKVAAVNGDLRRILQICRRAKEIFDAENEKMMEEGGEQNLTEVCDQITRMHILKAIEDLFDSKVQKVISNLQFYEKITLASILFEMKIQIMTKVNVASVFERFRYFCMRINKMSTRITFEEYMQVIFNLIKIQIITFNDSISMNFINNLISINFYADEFTTAVEKDEKFTDILKELA